MTDTKEIKKADVTMVNNKLLSSMIQKITDGFYDEGSPDLPETIEAEKELSDFVHISENEQLKDISYPISELWEKLCYCFERQGFTMAF